MSAARVSNERIAIVVCTYNRAPALASTIPVLLHMESVDELIVVVDGSTDNTVEVLAGFADPRLVVVQQERAGSSAARNAGVKATSAEWLLLLDDDDFFPPDYAVALWEVAQRECADIVGAPWVHVRASHVEDDLAAAKRRRSSAISLDTHPSVFPPVVIETPFIPARALVRAAVFDVIAFDPTYRVNGWREETSFYIEAVQAGFKVVLTPDTASFYSGSWGGGQQRGSLQYEYWILRNNLRFLRRHGSWLRAHGHVSSVYGEQIAFAVSRVAGVLGSWFRAKRARLSRLPVEGGLPDAG